MALFPILLIFFFIPLAICGPVATQLQPNFTFTTLRFIDSNGVILSSPNSTFFLAFYSPAQQQSRYYLYLIHSPSNSPVWSANPNSPVPATATLSLSSSALSLNLSNGTLAWSTPPLSSSIHSLQLLESGNLVLLDSSNSSLWQSFDHPTDSLLPGQRLASGSWLASPVSDSDFSDAGYRLLVTGGDVVLRWRGPQEYWSLSVDPRSLMVYNNPVAYLEINGTGMYLFDAHNRAVFYVLLLKTDGLRVGKMDSSGQFRIVTYDSDSGNVKDDFVAPNDACSLPLTCNTLGLCPAGSNVSTCSCPESFGQAQGGGCLPTDGSVLASPSSCSGASAVSYLTLGTGISYFANEFANPTDGSDFSSCHNACSRNCSCLGFFYRNSSMACYLIQNQLGSLIKGSSAPMIGYIKTLKSSSSSSPSSPNSTGKSSTNIVPILLPLIAATLLVLVLSFGFLWWRKRSNNKGSILDFNMRENKPVHSEAHLEDEVSDDEILIPGLPTRFTYTDLTLFTNNFQTLIGSGGFGTVYKGELPDKTLIAVKRITNTGIQGKREFCTEIAVIGSIHHVNLVNLRGYCCDGSNRLLVYEYMNRGSLDKPLFGLGLVLDWQERMEIATGAARGLAYLHSSCDHKILHFDIKPENILLSDQGQVKIGDFGIAKLMSREQSRTFTRLRGTRGYIAPEWLTNSALSDKTDVYSFGMVLFEIVGGRKNSFTGLVDSTGSGVEYFPLVALEKHMEGRWMELVDPRIKGRATQSEVMRVVKVALCCVHEKSSMRPSMGTVVGMLEGTVAVWEPGVEGLWYLRRYRRGGGGNTQSAEAVGTSSSSETSASLQTNISSDELSGPR